MLIPTESTLKPSRTSQSDSAGESAPTSSDKETKPAVIQAVAVNKSQPREDNVVRAKDVGKSPAHSQSEEVHRDASKRLNQDPEHITTEELLSEIKGQISPVPTSLSYRLVASLVALVMVLLPLIYIGIIVLVAYGVYSYAIHGVGIFQADTGPRSGRGGFALILMYVGPLVIGCVTVLFMIKPLFAKPAKRQAMRRIPRETDPKLFEFVDALCEAVHAPKPKRIQIDCDVNASASYGRGLMSIFLPSDLVLTIGLPLVAGLNTRQLAGVLAHEFGHFSQGFGMRISYLIRSISLWFARVVYERDRWDEWLENLSQSLDIRLGVVLYLARIAVWFSRRILWVLMMVGNGVSCALMRQMEYDADLHEIRFSGSKTFESTAIQLRRLGYAMQEAFSDQQEFFVKGQLAADMPELVRTNRDHQTNSAVKEILAPIETERTSWFATHPSDKDRIAHAQRASAPGIFSLERPARLLFSHYEKYCVATTQDLFDQVIGKRELKSTKIVPNDQLIVHKENAQAGRDALGLILGNSFQVLRPIDLTFSAIENAEEVGKNTINAMTPARDEYAAHCKQLDELETEWIKCGNLSFLLDLDIKLKQKDFDVPVGSAAQTRNKQEEIRQELQTKSSQMQPYEALLAQRFSAALTRLPKLANAGVPEARAAYLSAKRLSAGYPEILKVLADATRLRNDFAQLAFFFAAVDTSSLNDKQITGIREKGASVYNAAKKIRNHFLSTPYPLEHAEADITIARYLIEVLPEDEDDLAEICQAANAITEGYMRLYFSALAETCRIIQYSESAQQSST